MNLKGQKGTTFVMAVAIVGSALFGLIGSAIALRSRPPAAVAVSAPDRAPAAPHSYPPP